MISYSQNTVDESIVGVLVLDSHLIIGKRLTKCALVTTGNWARVCAVLVSAKTAFQRDNLRVFRHTE